MADAPTEIAPDWTLDEFTHQGKTYRVMVHSMGDEGGRRPALVADIEKIVHAQTEFWGAPEVDQYTFMIHFAADDPSRKSVPPSASSNWPRFIDVAPVNAPFSCPNSSDRKRFSSGSAAQLTSTKVSLERSEAR